MQLAMEAHLPELGGVVQQRELAAYMEAAHGESRRKRQRQVEEELKKPPVALANLLGEPVLSGMVEIDRLHETPIHQSRSVELAPPPRRARGLLFGALLVALGASAGALAFFASNATTREPPLGAPLSVILEITAKPAAAEIVLDGKRLGAGHFKGELPHSLSPHTLEVRAPGYESATRELRLEKDALIGVDLVPLAAPEMSASTDVAEQSDPEESAHRRRVRGVTRLPARASVPSAAPVVSAPQAAAPKVNCSPPYVLDRDGVKTYKPECL
jgi:hypothetical protein